MSTSSRQAAVPVPDSAALGAPRSNPLYFAVWRWHFYAGLYVIPFLVMLAVTGLAILWFKTIAPEFGEGLRVTPTAVAMTPAAQAEAARAALPGATGVTEYVTPWDATRAALVTVTDRDGLSQVVALDPYRGTALRVTPKENGWEALAERIHGTLMIGWIGDRLIELAAGLGLLLIVTGLWLWWPRAVPERRAEFAPDRKASGRGFWRSLHSVTGFWTAAILTTFLMTGMAWTGVWGEKIVQPWGSFPAEKFGAVPLSDEIHAKMNHGAKDVPWGLEQTQMPASGGQVGLPGLPEGTPVGLDSLVALGRSLGLAGRFQVALPADERGVWTLSQDSMSFDSTTPGTDRTVHVDRYTGRILADVRFADYPVLAKVMAVGTALHEGQVGLWNLVLNIVACAMILILCVTGAVLWWLRRPSGAARLAAPPMPAEVPLVRGVVLVALALSLVFPLLGAALIAVLVLDLTLLSAAPGLKRALS